MSRALQVLVGVGRLLAEARPDAALSAAARVVVEDFADVCLIESLHDRRFRPAAVCHRAPDREPALQAALEQRSEAADRALLTLVEAGRLDRCDGVVPDHLQVAGIRTAVLAPLLAGFRPVGLLTLGWSAAACDLGPDEWLIIEDFARRAAEVVARTNQPPGEEERFDWLPAAADALATADDGAVLAETLARLVVPALADAGAVYLIEGAESRLAVAVHQAPDEAAALRDDLAAWQADFFRPNGPFDRRPEGVPWLDVMVSGQSAQVFPLAAFRQNVGALLVREPADDQSTAAVKRQAIADLAGRAALVLAALRAREDARRAAAARDAFLANAAHELKTPITNLRGYAQFLLRRFTREETIDPAQLRHALRIFDQQSEKLARLVVQLLDVSRIVSGLLRLEYREVDLRRLLDGAIALHQAMHPDHRLTLHAPARAPIVVDPPRIEQVVSNLLDNAIRHSPKGSEIVLDVWQPNDRDMCFAVTDQGTGIAPEKRDSLFDRYFQAHNEAKLTGLGLGLSICRDIVVRHGGRIWAEFPITGGTRIVVSLPAGRATAPPNVEPPVS